MSLPFTKYQALGNDFILISAPDSSLPVHQVRALCDRHFGIGADGILLFCPQPDSQHDARMIVLNADGSRPEMCGNGLRCVAFHAAATGPSGPSTRLLAIATDAGPRSCTVELEPGSPTASVTVDMGTVRQIGPHLIDLPGRSLTAHLASIGNPHLIVFDRIDDDTFRHLAPLSGHHAFPDGINVSLVQPDPENKAITVRVWERGVGPTLACGTAACAATATAIANHLISGDRPITVHLPGGDLQVAFDPANGHALMTGPCTRVFDGHLRHVPVGVA